MTMVETLENCSPADGFYGSWLLLLVLAVYLVSSYFDGLNRISINAISLALITYSISFSTHACWDMQYATYGMWTSLGIVFLLCTSQIFSFLDHGTNTILLIGAAGSGKSTFTYGLVNEYRRDKDCSFSDGTESDYRVLFQEMENSWAQNTGHAYTDDFNSNKINFSVGYRFIPGEKQIKIYDFGGEQLKNTAPINRSGIVNDELYELTELQIGQDTDTKQNMVPRHEITHIIFLIGPDASGKYPDPSHSRSLQSNIDLILKLTMRTGKAKRDKKYKHEVRKFYHRLRAIKVHCFLTKASRQTREDGSVANDVLYDIAPELGRLVKATKGMVNYINIIDEDFNPDVLNMSIVANELKK